MCTENAVASADVLILNILLYIAIASRLNIVWY